MHLAAAIYYFCYKRTVLRISDPRYYEDLNWIKQGTESISWSREFYESHNLCSELTWHYIHYLWHAAINNAMLLVAASLPKYFHFYCYQCYYLVAFNCLMDKIFQFEFDIALAVQGANLQMMPVQEYQVLFIAFIPHNSIKFLLVFPWETEAFSFQ